MGVILAFWLLLAVHLLGGDSFSLPKPIGSLASARARSMSALAERFPRSYAMPLTTSSEIGAKPEAAPERPDAAQLAAIAADAPAILLIAGAGTGKTRVLAARLAHALRRRARAAVAVADATPSPLAPATAAAAVPPPQLMTLVLSFTSSAAQEICQQASALPGGTAALDSAVVWHGTFHSFAVRLLGQYPYLGTGLSRFTIADTQDQHAAVAAALRDLDERRGSSSSRARSGRSGRDSGVGSTCSGMGSTGRGVGSSGSGGSGGAGEPLDLRSTSTAHAVLRRLSVWKEQGLGEEQARAMLAAGGGVGARGSSGCVAYDDRMERLASEAYPLYQRHLRAGGKVDFGDLLLCAVALLQTQPAVLEHLHRELGHVLVDEFQVFFLTSSVQVVIPS